MTITDLFGLFIVAAAAIVIVAIRSRPPSEEERNMNSVNPHVSDKSLGVAYLLWFLLGLFGGHQFYLGKTGRAILYLLTGGIAGVGWVIDAFTLPSQVRMVNAIRRASEGTHVTVVNEYPASTQ